MEILKEVEHLPATYPTVDGLSEVASALDQNALWSRIETYIQHRFVERQVDWVIEGCEDDALRLPLTPVVSFTAEKWEAGAWVTISLPDGPLGHALPSDGTFRIVAQIGVGPVPAAVETAFRRLAEYSADTDDRSGATDFSEEVGGDLQESYTRYPSWLARAIMYSGAADLLRPYRRAW